MWCQLRARRRDEPSPAEGTASRCCSPAGVSVLRYEPSVLDCRKAAPGHVGAADSPLCPRGPDILVLFRFEKRNVIFPFGSSSRNGKRGTHSHPLPPSNSMVSSVCSPLKGPGTVLCLNAARPCPCAPRSWAHEIKPSFFFFFFSSMHLQPPASVIYAHPHACMFMPLTRRHGRRGLPIPAGPCPNPEATVAAMSSPVAQSSCGQKRSQPTDQEGTIWPPSGPAPPPGDGGPARTVTTPALPCCRCQLG